MSSNFLPKNVFKWKNADGSTTTAREYDFETFATLEAGHFFVMLLGGAVFGVFLAPILLLISLFTFNGGFNVRFLLTGLISAYVLLDTHNGWLMLRMLDFVFEESSLNTLIAVNSGVLAVSIILFFFGGLIHTMVTEMSENVTGRWLWFFGICLLLFMFGFYRGKASDNDTGWVSKKLEVENSEKQKIQDDYEKYQHMTDQQIEEEAQKDYEDQLRSEGKDPADYR